MNWAHIHLIINHFPVIGMIFAVLLLVYALMKKSEELTKAALGAFVLIALITIPVYLTGEAAEDIVKKLPEVTETLIGRHEEAASVALTLMMVAGISSLAGLLLFHSRPLPKWLMIAILVLAFVTSSVMGLTANLGGLIRHTEIRKEGIPARPSSPAKAMTMKDLIETRTEDRGRSRRNHTIALRECYDEEAHEGPRAGLDNHSSGQG